MTNAECSATSVQTPFYTVAVTPVAPADMEPGSGTLSGKVCFDINRSNWDEDCGMQSARASHATNFATLGPVNYTFTASASGTKSNLRFQIVDPAGCVESSSGGKAGTIADNEEINLTVNYKTSLSETYGTIYGRTRDQAAFVTIYAIYNNGAKEVSIPLAVRIQDCHCCGAFVAAGVWKQFMCHNLGADTSLDPFTPAKGLNGDYYQWGIKYPVATVDTPSGGISGWNTNGAPNNAWDQYVKTANDPCPNGFRLPTYTEWYNARTYNINSYVGNFISGHTYDSGLNIGNDLYVPAAGFRDEWYGGLYELNQTGYYWMSSVTGNVTFKILLNESYIERGWDRLNAMPVRCIAE
jgi:uncharacterized protein (TIGR02145 family)